MRHAGWNSWSPKKLSGDYVATDVVRDGKTSEVGKMDNFLDGLVVKKNARVVPLSGDEGMSHPEGMWKIILCGLAEAYGALRFRCHERQ